jgi:glutaconate CoA-transferase, subunit B
MSEQYFSTAELVVVETAKYIKDGMTIFVGIGLGLLTASLAIKTHAPNATIVMEGGTVDSKFVHFPFSVCEPRSAYGCSLITGLTDILGYSVGGRHVDMAVLGAAQADQYGNLNSTMGPKVSGQPIDVLHPGWRATGSGGANDSASAIPFVLNIAHEKRRFPAYVDYLTSPGWKVKKFENGKTKWVPRAEAGLIHGGPVAIVTTQCIMKFDEKTKVAYLAEYFPGLSPVEIKKTIDWDIDISKAVETKPPSREVIRILREEVDPTGILLGSLRK